jgi:hypothetical protein
LVYEGSTHQATCLNLTLNVLTAMAANHNTPCNVRNLAVSVAVGEHIAAEPQEGRLTPNVGCSADDRQQIRDQAILSVKVVAAQKVVRQSLE